MSKVSCLLSYPQLWKKYKPKKELKKKIQKI
nr:MAG TPA: hypothetical protein [Caudoviricetes sp.]